MRGFGHTCHLPPSSLLVKIPAMLPWHTLSDFDRCYAMAPKPKRWRYKPGQRERRERRLEREVAEARLAGDRSGPPLTLFHPRLSASLPDHVFQEEAVTAASVTVSSSEEYEDVLLEEDASSSAAPASGSRLQPKPKKRPKTSPGHGDDSRGRADRPTDRPDRPG